MAWVPKGRCGGEHQGHLHEPNFSCPDCSNRGTPFDGSSGRSAPRRNWHRIGAQGRAGTVDLRSSIFAVIRIANSLPDWLHFPGQCSCNYTVMRDCHPRFVDGAVSSGPGINWNLNAPSPLEEWQKQERRPTQDRPSLPA